MSARAIGELIVPILERAERLHGIQVLIGGLETPEQKKRVIMDLRERSSITGAEASLLIEAHMLEDA